MRTLKQSGTRPVFFLLVLTSDHITGATGLTPTVTISKDGAAFGAPAGTVAEIANGWYKLTPTSADTGTLGALLLHASGTAADPVDHIYQVVAYDPESATNLGLTNLDAAISSRSTYAGGAVASVTGSVGSVVGLTASNLDVAVSTRMATYTQPTGFLAATFPSSVGTSTYAGGAVASVTGNVGGNVVGSVASVTARVTANADQLAGQTVTAAAGVTFPTSVASPTNITAATGVVLSGVTHTGAVVPTVTTVGTLTTYTGNTPQTGDAFARLGVPAGASHAADVAAVKVDTAATGTKASDIQSRLPAALVSGRIDASVGAVAAGVITTAAYAVGAIDSTVLSSNAEQAIADKTLATAVDGTISLKQLLQIIAAACDGKVSGAATTTVTIRNVSDTANAIVATVDANGNRSAVTYTFT